MIKNELIKEAEGTAEYLKGLIDKGTSAITPSKDVMKILSELQPELFGTAAGAGLAGLGSYMGGDKVTPRSLLLGGGAGAMMGHGYKHRGDVERLLAALR